MELDEKFYPWEDGRPGGKYKDDDGTEHELYDWETMNRCSNFEAAAKKKGEFAWFSYTHNIGNYFNEEQDRSYWLGKESHYDEDHFFFITGVPGMEDKRIAFQLRVSNHNTKHEQWESTHSEGYNNAKRTKLIRPGLKADFCLNLVMNPLGRINDDTINKPAVKIKILSIDVPFDYYNKPASEQKEIDSIIKKITDGLRPTISYDTIVNLFGNGTDKNLIRTTGPGEFREHNFTDRQNQIYNRGTFFKFIDEPKKKKEIVQPGQIPVEMKMSDIPLQDSGEFEFDGRKYYFDYNEFVVYPEKTRRGAKYFDKETKIPVTENRLKITRGDLLEMVNSVLRQIIC